MISARGFYLTLGILLGVVFWFVVLT